MAQHAPLREHRHQVVERVDRMDAGQRQRLAGIDAANERVRIRAADERDMQHTRQRDVVEVAALAGEQRQVLAAGRLAPIIVIVRRGVTTDLTTFPRS